MDEFSYAALIVEPDGALTAHGPCTSGLMARLVMGTVRMTRSIFAATAGPLMPPGDDLDSTLTQAPPIAVLELPDVITEQLAAYRDRHPVAPEHHGPVAVFVTTAHGSGALGVLIGPFANTAQAHTWTHPAATTHEDGERRARFPGAENASRPLRAIDVQIIALQPPDGTDPDGERAVLALETDDVGWQVYGPFTDTLQATAYFHEISSVPSITNARAVHVLPVNVPDPRGGSTLLRPPVLPAGDHDVPVLPHIVVCEVSDTAVQADSPVPVASSVYAIGWFTDAEAAARWLDTDSQPLPSHISAHIRPVHEP